MDANTLSPEAIAALEQGNKIEAIKITRLKTGKDLKDSKDAVEAWLAGNPALAQKYQENTATGSGMGGLVFFLFVIAVLVAWWFFKS